MAKRKLSEASGTAVASTAESSQDLSRLAQKEKKRSKAVLEALDVETEGTSKKQKVDQEDEKQDAVNFDPQEEFVKIGGEMDEGDAKGKSKDEKERINTTLFVSSLPYETTTTDLITHFSFIGPVKTGFVVKDRNSGLSKGVGYVTYASREDAEKALEDLNNGPFGAETTRKIRVGWAEKKPSQLERKTRPVVENRKPVQPRAPGKVKNEAGAIVSNAAHDPNAIRTLVVSGIPNEVDKNTLWKKVRKLDGISSKDSLVYPVQMDQDGNEREADEVKRSLGGDAHILFETHQAATAALPKLHAHVYKGSTLSCILKKKVEKTIKANRAGRLIIRNLAWQVTTEDLRHTFLPFGPLVGVTLPTVTVEAKDGSSSSKPSIRAKGFAFVWFLEKADAEKALAEMNGKEIKGRPVAVDWALSKEKWEETKEHVVPAEESTEANSVEDAAGSSSKVGQQDEHEGTDGGADASDAEESEQEEDEASGAALKENQPVKPTLPAVEEGSTVFIRNLPFEVTEEEVRNLFRTFGPLRYAKITIDHSTGRSRGTAFACFWKREDADKVLEEAARVQDVTGANATPIANPFSVLTVDPSSSAASKLVLHGRTLDVVRALTREDASMKKEDAERMRRVADKRNTYLMREGVIFPNTPAAATLPETEVEKRVTSFKTRRQLLESNPSLYISKTRLSIRQLPLFVTDRTLKKLAIQAVRAFDDEVKQGTREDLSREEKMDETMSAVLEGRKKKRGERSTAVVQSKVQRQTDKYDPLTGAGRSKGFGFLEMRSHREALKVLRWANNNPAVGPLLKEWFESELQDIEKGVKEKLSAARENKAENLDDLEIRYKRVQQTIKEGVTGSGMRQGKTLLIEFSVENVQVVKRRVDKMSNGPGTDAPRGQDRGESQDRKRKRTDDVDGTKETQGNNKRAHQAGRPGKTPRSDQRPSTQSNANVESAPENSEKKGSNIGGLIGRKRKERRQKK